MADALEILFVIYIVKMLEFVIVATGHRPIWSLESSGNSLSLSRTDKSLVLVRNIFALSRQESWRFCNPVCIIDQLLPGPINRLPDILQRQSLNVNIYLGSEIYWKQVCN